VIALLLLGCSMAGKWDEDTAGPRLDDDTVSDDTLSDDTDAEAAPSDLVITELLTNADAVSDDLGEWIELTNIGATALVLDGLDVRDEDDDGFTVPTLTLAPGARVVFGASADPSLNGGVTVALAYDVALFKLGNEDGRVAVSLDGRLLDAVTYDATFPAAEGASLSLSPDALSAVANEEAAAWCLGTRVFGAGDLGTPGAENDACGDDPGDTDTDTDPDADTDGDGFTDDDCDPDDADVYPGADEDDNNGDDDDCDGWVDERAPEDEELVIGEIMKDTDPTPDETGEWFEIVNVSDAPLELDGLTVTDEGGTGFTVATTDVLEPGAVYLLALSGDPALNDGLAPDYVYDPADLRLGNGTDTLVLTYADITVDTVSYDDEFPDEAGKSLSLDPAHLDADDNDDSENWCEGDGDYGTDGNQGTPGEPNDGC